MTDRVRRSAARAGTFEIGDGLTVNRLGFGAMRLTGSRIWGDSSEPEGHGRWVLRRALELGVNLIDTADFYGPETNENLIREALYPYPEDLLIATKGGAVVHGPGDWSPDGRPEHLREACEASMKRLGVEHIDLYQFHVPDPEVPYEESIGALAELKAEGKVRNVGISNVDLHHLKTARSIVSISSVQNRYNIAERAAGDLVEVCEQAGVAFLPFRPLATGDLAGPEGPISRIARKYDATTGQVALAWLLRRSPVMVPIPGTSSVDHLEENVAAAGVVIEETEMRILDAA